MKQELEYLCIYLFLHISNMNVTFTIGAEMWIAKGYPKA
jgi:hypothetical protein